MTGKNTEQVKSTTDQANLKITQSEHIIKNLDPHFIKARKAFILPKISDLT